MTSSTTRASSRLNVIENAQVVTWLISNREMVLRSTSKELAKLATADLGFEVSKGEINWRRNAAELKRQKPEPEVEPVPIDETIYCAVARLASILSAAIPGHAEALTAISLDLWDRVPVKQNTLFTEEG